VAVNCAAVPATLAESEFFGAERGAFTDAKETREGFFEQAHQGTLFLDEVGELSTEIQAKLLRVLQEREVTRLGAARARSVDVRIVTATNRDLRHAATAGRFREDLFWRLNVFPIHLPPLRDRRDDIGLLTAHLIDRLNIELATQVTGIADDVRVLFEGYGWPGNVRELENALRYAMIVTESSVLQLEHFQRLRRPNDHADTGPDDMAGLLSDIVARSTARVERSAIQAALKRHRGNRTETAAALGIGRRTLFNKLRQLRLVEPNEPDDEPA
jgi:transcriptional regulator with PAS, ATPase and Fis domain